MNWADNATVAGIVASGCAALGAMELVESEVRRVIGAEFESTFCLETATTCFSAHYL